MIFDSTIVIEGGSAPEPRPSEAGVPGALAPQVCDFLLEWLGQDGDALAAKDAATGVYLYASPQLTDWLGCASPLGKTDAELLDAATAKLMLSADQTALTHGTSLRAEHRIEREGQRRELIVLRHCLERPGGRRYLMSVWRDMTAQRRKEAQLRIALEQLEQQQIANAQLRRETHDPLLRDRGSGLATRATFEDQLNREIDLSTREHREFAMVLVDLDTVSPESLGQDPAVMERVHETLGRLLRNNTRAMDASCRYDERRFAVLLSGVGLATAHARVEGLRRQCATQIVAHGGQEVGFTTSMGVASFPHTASDKEALQSACLAALADAKRRGGNRVALASIQFEGSGSAVDPG
jgi:diguanylate cyclase (GGDEF)-like protein